MQRKCYAVVTLPKEDQGNLIEINKKDIYESWHEATDAFKTVVEHLTGLECNPPKTPQPLCVESSAEMIQIWVCYLPIGETENPY